MVWTGPRREIDNTVLVPRQYDHANSRLPKRRASMAVSLESRLQLSLGLTLPIAIVKEHFDPRQLVNASKDVRLQSFTGIKVKAYLVGEQRGHTKRTIVLNQRPDFGFAGMRGLASLTDEHARGTVPFAP